MALPISYSQILVKGIQDVGSQSVLQDQVAAARNCVLLPSANCRPNPPSERLQVLLIRRDVHGTLNRRGGLLILRRDALGDAEK